MRYLTSLVLLALLTSCSDRFNTEDSGGPPDGGVSDGPVAPVVEECPNPPLSPPSSGTCKVTTGGASVLYRGSVLAPGRVLHNGHLLVEGGKVRCAACDCSKQPAFSGATQVECAKGVISAAFVNAHDHLGWTTAPPQQSDVRYSHREEWQTGRNGMPPIKYPGSSYKTEPLLWGEVRMVMSGVVSIAGEGGIKGMIRNLDKDNEGLGKAAINNKTFPLGDGYLTSGCGYSAVPLLSTITAASAYVPHVSEGINLEARNEFLCLSGQQAGGVDATRENAAFIHAVGLTAIDIADMARGGTAAILSPRSNISLYGMTANLVAMDYAGVKMSISTDWTISGSMNMLRELACLDQLNSKHLGGHLSDQKLFEMATLNGAIAARASDVIGQLKEGTFADLAIWNGSQRADYSAVLRAGAADVVLVTKAGVPLYGDEELVKALAPSSGQGCEPIEVCSVPKSLCLQRETQKTLAALKAVVPNAYPLFFCGTPDGEPTCVPSRPSEFDGKSTAADGDGDGIPNDKDTCPKVFNPFRKIEGMKQLDSDGDKLGDECDPCPFQANATKCGAAAPNDKDGDSITDDKDNCPVIPNKGQEDADKDGIGDACDACPTANPGGTSCAFTIRDLRDRSLGKRPPDGTLVKIQNAVVTGVRTTKAGNFGFFVREGTGPFQAILVFTNNAAPVDATGKPLQPGDRVSLEGKLAEFNNIDELEAPAQVTVDGSGDLTPVAVKTADLRPASGSGEGLESQLVQVSNVTVAALVNTASPSTTDSFWVADDGAACTGTTPACTKVSDFFFDGGKVDGQPAASVGNTFSAVTGCVNGYKNDYSLDPRSAADLVP